MDTRRHRGYRIALRIALLVALAVGLLAPAAATAQSDESSAGVTFTKDIAPILQRSCQQCHHPDGVAPMSLITYEEVRPWARAIKTRTGLGPRGAYAALVRREEHRDPEIQERPLPQRRGDRQDREMGGQRRTTRQSGRHAAATAFRQHRQVDDRGTGSGAAVAGSDRPGCRARQVGIDSGSCRRVSRKTGTCRPSRSERSTTFPSGGATNTVGGRYAFHHMTYSSRGARASVSPAAPRKAPQLADSRSRAQRRYLSARSRQAAGGEFGLVSRQLPSPLERPRDQSASRVRFQVLSEGIQAALPALEPAAGQWHRHRREAESSQSGAPRVCHAAGAHQDHRVRAPHARARRAHVPGGDLGPQHPDAQLRGIRPQLGQAVRVRGRCRAAVAEGHHRAPHRFPRHHARQQEPRGRQKLGWRRPAVGGQHVHQPRLFGVAHRGTVPGRDGQAAGRT